MSNKKISVVVLYGGSSSEHEISLQSAASVIQNLDRNKYEILPIGIDKFGEWHIVELGAIEQQMNNELPLPLSAPKGLLAPGTIGQDVFIQGKDDPNLLQSIDVVFPVLHGPLCEDGSIQGMLETAGVAYVGADVLGSAIGMDKDVAKRLAKQAGIPVVPSHCYRQWEWNQLSEATLQKIHSELGSTLFVKPVNMGSSVGVSKTKNFAELKSAVENAFLYDEKVLIEKAIDVREIELAALENLAPGEGSKISIPGEIIPQHEFYSYESKYLDENGATLEIPAKTSEAQVTEAQEIAKKAFSVLECSGMARIDLFLDKANGQFFLNEINTIPGFTKISMYPKLWEASGLSYGNLLTHLLELAMQRHERKKRISREFLELK